MDKDAILKLVIQQLNQQVDTMHAAAKTAHEASTGAESRAESKYDTRGLEASYLADAQAEQCQKLAESLQILSALKLTEQAADTPVQSGSLVETELDGEFSHYLLLPSGGGIQVTVDGYEITTLSPEAPLYQKLLDSHSGEILSNPPLMVMEIS